MVILNKNQVEIEINQYKKQDKIEIIMPDPTWAKFHFNKANYNLRVARINFNLNDDRSIIKKLEMRQDADIDFDTYEWVIIKCLIAKNWNKSRQTVCT